ncbi:MAG: ROK family transcriptional regulator [Actinomycetaceae bacterium]|nr:ROK family transcriptional regulator [Actinomycetaceae bacterium]
MVIPLANSAVAPGEYALASTRENSVNAVLDVLASEPFTFTITEICRITTLSRPTVTRILNDLIDLDVANAQTASRSHSSGGRRPQIFSLNRFHHCSVVLRVNYDVVEGWAIDAAGGIIKSVSLPPVSAGDISDRLAGALTQILQAVDSTVYAVAVVVMGIVDQGRVVRSESFPELNSNSWIGQLNAILDDFDQSARVVALNDAKVAAKWMYSQCCTLGVGPESMIAIHCSEDFGCGLVFGGNLLEGAHGAAGEILQDEGSMWSKASSFLRKIEQDQDVSLREFFANAEAYDQENAFIEPLGRLMGKALSSMVLTLDPDAVAIGGAIVDCGPRLLTAIEQELRKATPTPPSVHVSPQGAQSVSEGAKMHVLAEARRTTLQRVLPPADQNH